MLAIAIGLLFSLTKGLRRLDRISAEARVKPGTEVHETHVGANAAHLEADGNGDGAGDEEESAERRQARSAWEWSLGGSAARAMITATSAARPSTAVAAASCQWFCQKPGFARSRV